MRVNQRQNNTNSNAQASPADQILMNYIGQLEQLRISLLLIIRRSDRRLYNTLNMSSDPRATDRLISQLLNKDKSEGDTGLAPNSNKAGKNTINNEVAVLQYQYVNGLLAKLIRESKAHPDLNQLFRWIKSMGWDSSAKGNHIPFPKKHDFGEYLRHISDTALKECLNKGAIEDVPAEKEVKRKVLKEASQTKLLKAERQSLTEKPSGVRRSADKKRRSNPALKGPLEKFDEAKEIEFVQNEQVKKQLAESLQVKFEELNGGSGTFVSDYLNSLKNWSDSGLDDVNEISAKLQIIQQVLNVMQTTEIAGVEAFSQWMNDCISQSRVDQKDPVLLVFKKQPDFINSLLRDIRWPAIEGIEKCLFFAQEYENIEQANYVTSDDKLIHERARVYMIKGVEFDYPDWQFIKEVKGSVDDQVKSAYLQQVDQFILSLPTEFCAKVGNERIRQWIFQYVGVGDAMWSIALGGYLPTLDGNMVTLTLNKDTQYPKRTAVTLYFDHQTQQLCSKRVHRGVIFQQPNDPIQVSDLPENLAVEIIQIADFSSENIGMIRKSYIKGTHRLTDDEYQLLSQNLLKLKQPNHHEYLHCKPMTWMKMSSQGPHAWKTGLTPTQVDQVILQTLRNEQDRFEQTGQRSFTHEGQTMLEQYQAASRYILTKCAIEPRLTQYFGVNHLSKCEKLFDFRSDSFLSGWHEADIFKNLRHLLRQYRDQNWDVHIHARLHRLDVIEHALTGNHQLKIFMSQKGREAKNRIEKLRLAIRQERDYLLRLTINPKSMVMALPDQLSDLAQKIHLKDEEIERLDAMVQLPNVRSAENDRRLVSDQRAVITALSQMKPGVEGYLKEIAPNHNENAQITDTKVFRAQQLLDVINTFEQLHASKQLAVTDYYQVIEVIQHIEQQYRESMYAINHSKSKLLAAVQKGLGHLKNGLNRSRADQWPCYKPRNSVTALSEPFREKLKEEANKHPLVSKPRPFFYKILVIFKKSRNVSTNIPQLDRRDPNLVAEAVVRGMNVNDNMIWLQDHLHQLDIAHVSYLYHNVSEEQQLKMIHLLLAKVGQQPSIWLQKISDAKSVADIDQLIELGAAFFKHPWITDQQQVALMSSFFKADNFKLAKRLVHGSPHLQSLFQTLFEEREQKPVAKQMLQRMLKVKPINHALIDANRNHVDWLKQQQQSLIALGGRPLLQALGVAPALGDEHPELGAYIDAFKARVSELKQELKQSIRKLERKPGYVEKVRSLKQFLVYDRDHQLTDRIVEIFSRDFDQGKKNVTHFGQMMQAYFSESCRFRDGAECSLNSILEMSRFNITNNDTQYAHGFSDQYCRPELLSEKPTMSDKAFKDLGAQLFAWAATHEQDKSLNHTWLDLWAMYIEKSTPFICQKLNLTPDKLTADELLRFLSDHIETMGFTSEQLSNLQNFVNQIMNDEQLQHLMIRQHGVACVSFQAAIAYVMNERSISPEQLEKPKFETTTRKRSASVVAAKAAGTAAVAAGAAVLAPHIPHVGAMLSHAHHATALLGASAAGVGAGVSTFLMSRVGLHKASKAKAKDDTSAQPVASNKHQALVK